MFLLLHLSILRLEFVKSAQLVFIFGDGYIEFKLSIFFIGKNRGKTIAFISGNFQIFL